jgi:DNA-binding IclR family transcriptional regulator
MTKPPQSSIVSKCAAILDILAASGKPLGFTDIVNQSGFVKSSTHRILGILQSEGLVIADGGSRSYRLGPRLVQWAARAWHKSDLQQAAGVELEALARDSGQNVALAVRDGDRALYLRTVDNQQIRYVARAGEHSPLHCTAVGKVLIAFLPGAERGELIQRIELERFSENTITDISDFAREIERVGQAGYAISDGEEFLQVCGIAAPVFDFDGSITAGVCIWSLRREMPMSELLQQAGPLREACALISQRLGFQ